MAVQHVDPAETATASGINALVRLVGSAVAGVVAPVLLTVAGPAAALAAPACAALLAALVSTAGRPARTRPRVATGEHA
jgi:nitrate/nitrite transporter NarK